MDASGVRTKLTDFYTAIYSTFYDVVILTETWLLQFIRDTMLALDDEWSILRRDPHGPDSFLGRGGRVLIATRNSLSPKIISSGEHERTKHTRTKASFGVG